MNNPGEPAPHLNVIVLMAGSMLLGALYWVLIWAPAHDERLYTQQRTIESCRTVGGTPIIWDDAIQCIPPRKSAR